MQLLVSWQAAGEDQKNLWGPRDQEVSQGVLSTQSSVLAPILLIILRENDSSTRPQSTFTFSKAAQLWKTFVQLSLHENICTRPYFCVQFSPISPSRWPQTSKRTHFSMMERSPTVATSVAIRASKLLVWKPTCWFTVERSLLFATSATTLAQQLVT